MNWVESLQTMHNYYTGNIATIILVSMLFVANYAKKSTKKRDDWMLMHLLGNLFMYSLVEILSCMLDGLPGSGMTILLYVLNSALYILNMVLEISWVQFVAMHMGYEPSRAARNGMSVLMAIGLLLMVVNLFRPLVFSLQNNVYEEKSFYYVYVIIGLMYLMYTIEIYHVCKQNGGALKYFPVWLFVIPAVAGILLENLLSSAFIGICNASAISAVLVNLRQEEVFRDRLTGLYNRAYLEEVRAKLEKTPKPFVSGIMLDLNDFKSINDRFGHAEGDQALIITSDLLRQIVGSYGDVIRYAGDEFIVLLNTTDLTELKLFVERIRARFDAFNSKKSKPYQLTISAGYANFNAGTQTVNEFLNLIDKDMYENKRLYYESSRADRRRPV